MQTATDPVGGMSPFIYFQLDSTTGAEPMRSIARVMVALIALALSYQMGLALAEEKAPADLPIRKVILYKHGVGYFERAGTVKGNEPVTLRMKKDQMNDLLKSLTAFDLKDGSTASVSYGSSKTIERLLSEYSFDLRKDTGMPGLLAQLQGAPVTMKVADKPITGVIVGVEPRRETRRDEVVHQTYKISVMTENGEFRSYDISEISSLEFTDPNLNEDLHDVLGVLFTAHRRDTKNITIRAEGDGDHKLIVAYTVETPVWKATYRLLLGKEQARLQGLAIVDNTTEEEWKDVDLALVSGMPVSFVMNLYDPRYKNRPRADIEEEYAAAPVVSERQLGALADAPAEKAAADAKGQMRRAPAAAAAPMLAAGRAERRKADDLGIGANAASMDKLMTYQQMATTVRDIGELFEYKIDHPVSIPRDQSALLPIVNKPVDAKKLSLYNESTRPGNPMSAVRLKNATGLTLEGGPVTIYDDSTYAGEAIFTTLKDQETRYVSYAVDLGTTATTKYNSSQQPVFRVQISRGIMITHFKLQETKTYSFNNMDDREKSVIIEHPMRPGWQLVGNLKPLERTENYYRFELKLPKRGPAEFAVKEEMPQATSYEVTNVTPDLIAVFIQRKYIDQQLEKKFQDVLAIKNEIAAIDAQIAQIDRDKDDIAKDQGRIRDNLKSLGDKVQDDQLSGRYKTKLNEQEDTLEKLGNTRAALVKQRLGKQKSLDDALAALNDDRQIQ